MLGQLQLTCHIGNTTYSESATTGDARVKGLAFSMAGGAMGPNIMTYRGDFETHPYGVGDSQIELLRKYFRWQVSIIFPQSVSDVFDGGFTGTWDALSHRPLLGSWNLREPAAKLDFDGDGR